MSTAAAALLDALSPIGWGALALVAAAALAMDVLGRSLRRK